MSALTLTASQRSALRGLAHGLDARVHIGQHGVSASVLAEIDSALRAHGLIKVRVLEAERAQREEMLEEIANALFCAPVQHIGRMLVLWRPRPQDAVQLKVDAPSMKEESRGAKSASKTTERAPRRSEGGRASPARPERGARSSTRDAEPRRSAARRDGGETPRSREKRPSDFPRFAAEAPRVSRPRAEDSPRRERSEDSVRRPVARRQDDERVSARPRRPRESESTRTREDNPGFVADAAPRRREGGSLKSEWFKGGDRESPARSEMSSPRPRPARASSDERTPAKPRTRSADGARRERAPSPRGRKPSR